MTRIMSILSMLCGLLSCNAQNNGYRSLTVAEYEKAITAANVIKVDVRTAEEYAEGHITGAINIDVQKADFEEKAKATLPKNMRASLSDKTLSPTLIAVNCRSGRRSKNAAAILAKNGYKVVELNEGFSGWESAGRPVTKEEVDLFVSPDGTPVHSYCIKHGTVRMQIADKWLYVDPVISKVQPVTDYTVMPKADILLITHEHADHLDAQAIAQLTKSETMLITNPRSSEQVGGKGLVMKNGDSQTAAQLKIEAVPAYNCSPDKQQFHPKGRDNGYIVTIPSQDKKANKDMRIYIAGDTEDIEEMQQIKDIDVAFLPCNLPFTMTPQQLAHAAQIIKPRVLFPYHYGQTDIQQVADLLKGSATEVRIRQYQ